MLGNFLATRIRHRLCFHTLPRHQRPLMCRMVLPPLVAPLVPRSRLSVERGFLEVTAHLVAVALSPVVRPADVESPSA